MGGKTKIAFTCMHVVFLGLFQRPLRSVRPHHAAPKTLLSDPFPEIGGGRWAETLLANSFVGQNRNLYVQYCEMMTGNPNDNNRPAPRGCIIYIIVHFQAPYQPSLFPCPPYYFLDRQSRRERSIYRQTVQNSIPTRHLTLQ